MMHYLKLYLKIFHLIKTKRSTYIYKFILSRLLCHATFFKYKVYDVEIIRLYNIQ